MSWARLASLGASTDCSRLTRIQELRLQGDCRLKELRFLCRLTALHTVELRCVCDIEQLPFLVALTALKTLDLSGFQHLLQVPPPRHLDCIADLHFGRRYAATAPAASRQADGIAENQVWFAAHTGVAMPGCSHESADNRAGNQ
jgi:hypothetical protein